MITRSPMQWMLLPLQRYAQFSGRAPRAEYWWFVLFSVLVSIPSAIIDAVIGLDITGALVSLGLLCPTLAVSVRRLHDLDRSGWWAALPSVSILLALVFGMIDGPAKLRDGNVSIAGVLCVIAIGTALLCTALLLVWYCTRGTAGPNRYGDDPLAEAANPTLYYG